MGKNGADRAETNGRRGVVEEFLQLGHRLGRDGDELIPDAVDDLAAQGGQVTAKFRIQRSPVRGGP
jgi:hypothetical protein